MNLYRRQIESLIRAVWIESTSSYRWFGKRWSFPDSPDPRQVLVFSLQHRLYRDFYVTGGPKPAAPDPESSAGAENAEFAHRLAVANRGAGRWGDASAVLNQGEDGLTLERDRLLVVAPASSWRSAGNERVQLREPAGFVKAFPGYCMAVGDQDLYVAGEVVRVYWHLSPLGAIEAMTAMTTRLNAARLAFRLKAVTTLTEYYRGDSVVLYLAKQDWSTVRSTLSEVAAELARYRQDGVPALTRELARGMAVAEDPGGGASFGMHRCRLIAEGLMAAFEAGARDVTSRSKFVAQAFADAGLVLEEPYLSPGSTAGYDLPRERPRRVEKATQPPPEEVGEASLRQAVADAARHLCRTAVWYEERCTWLGRTLDGRGLSALGPDVYAGTSGVALFLAQYAVMMGDDEARRTAAGAVRHALNHTCDLNDTRIGLYTGWPGIAIAAWRVGSLLHETSLAGDAAALAESRVEASHSLDSVSFDLLDGRAGAIIALLRLAEALDAPEWLSQAMIMGGALVDLAEEGSKGTSWRNHDARNEQNLTGFSHGAAGAIYALAELYRATSEGVYRETAERALEFERGWFDANAGNWPDFRGVARSRSFSSTLPFVTHWCHGAPGIALSRVHAHSVLHDPVLLQEAKAGLATTNAAVTRALASPESLSLCHGLAGNADVLLQAARYLEDTHLLSTARRSAAVMARELSGSIGVPLPGLMTGQAGQGYFLLRVLDPSVPSVLLFDDKMASVPSAN